MPKYSYLEISCCLLLADCVESGKFLFCVGETRAQWKLWIYFVWHTAFCVPLKMYFKTYKYIHLNLSQHLIFPKRYFSRLWILFSNLLLRHFCEIKILLSHNGWNMQTNSFLLPRLVSVCYISMFLCQQKCRQKSDWMYVSCTPEPHQSSLGWIGFPSIYYHLLLFTGN